MGNAGEIRHFEQAPEVYLVDESLHVIDRIDGQVTLHKVYPASIADKFARRVKALAGMSDLVARLAAAPIAKAKRKRKKKR